VLHGRAWWQLAVAVAATCLIASSNYVLNEILDAPRDRHHPLKRSRPVPSGLVSVPIAYAEWILLAVRRQGSFRWTAGAAVDWRERGSDWPQTRYEAKALRAGRRCTYMRFRRH